MVKLAKVHGGEDFDTMQAEVNNLVDAHSETLTNNLFELTKSAIILKVKAPDPEEDMDEVGQIIEHLSDLLMTAKEGGSMGSLFAAI